MRSLKMLVPYEPWVYNGPFPEGQEPKELWGVKILEGTFAGTTLSFNNVDLQDGDSNLELDYTVVYPPEGKDKDFCQGIEFESILQSIIVDILNKAVDLYENRNGNTSESST